MEFTDSRTLSEIIGKEVGPLHYEEVVPLFIQILEELCVAKAEGKILRALNPFNIFITGEQKIQIVDFGGSKSQGAGQRHKTGGKSGHLFYHSPEKARGENIDEQSNIYSMGIMLYEMLAGRLPFEREETTSDFTLMNKIAREKIKDPREFNPSIPDWLVEIIAKATEKEKSTRIKTFETFISLLKDGKETFEKELKEEQEKFKQLQAEMAEEEKLAQEKLVIFRRQESVPIDKPPAEPKPYSFENRVVKKGKSKKKKIVVALFLIIVFASAVKYYLDKHPFERIENEWMTKNLNVDHYGNGDTIPEVSDPKKWEKLKTGAWCYYDNEPENDQQYGKLYNWYAVNDTRGLAPKGWHIPSNKEFEKLITEVTRDSEALKSMRKGEINLNGFSLISAGGRDTTGYFYDLDYVPYYWSLTQSDTLNAYQLLLRYHDTNISLSTKGKGYGFSIRCVKTVKKKGLINFLYEKLYHNSIFSSKWLGK
ncbi:MAG: FISUMP domain-containing protein [Ignavibacteriaceae bacterium]